jgi:hypothetical protein
VKLEIKDGVLKISSSRPSRIKQAVVYIPVQQLESIIVKGYSDVRSLGMLNSQKLKISIEGECLVNIVNRGQVIVNNGPSYAFDCVKTKISL